MTHIRAVIRSVILSGMGSVSTISPGVHVLAGHYMGRDKINDQAIFLKLLSQLSKSARFINIETACDLIARKVVVDEPLISFTFDDGFSECYSHIAPALESFGVNAAFFINPGFVYAESDYIKNFTESVVKIPGKQPMLDWQIRELADRGFIIGAHTIDHVDLNSSDIPFLQHQIVDCKRQVELITGKSCDWFAWTFGGYKHISEDALKVAIDNYSVVFSSDDYLNYTSNNGKVLNRRHFEADWRVSNIKYFLRSSRFYEGE